MAFGSFQQRGGVPLASMSDINVTPMVDVMLVLLVIFILAAPMFTHAVKLELPKADARGEAVAGETVNVANDAQGRVFWNNQPVSPLALEARLALAARQARPPQLQLRADRNTRYEAVASLMAAAQSHGLQRLGFVTDPAQPHSMEKN